MEVVVIETSNGKVMRVCATSEQVIVVAINNDDQTIKEHAVVIQPEHCNGLLEQARELLKAGLTELDAHGRNYDRKRKKN